MPTYCNYSDYYRYFLRYYDFTEHEDTDIMMEIDANESLILISVEGLDLVVVGKSNTTPKKGGLMNPLKEAVLIFILTADAEHAEDLFNFFAFR